MLEVLSIDRYCLAVFNNILDKMRGYIPPLYTITILYMCNELVPK
jgi:hypothetical protein